MRTSFALASLVAASFLAGAADAQMTQTLPRGFDTVEGNGSTSFPFNSTATHKWHWVYDSTQFDATIPIIITEVAVRPNGGLAAWGPSTYDNFEMSLGASQNDYTVGNYDLTFDNNFVAGSKQVFVATGPLNVPAATGGASPNPWSILFAPTGGGYQFDPSQGNDFIVELRTPGSGAGNPTTHSTDGASAGAGLNGGNRYGNTTNANATTATFNNNEFVPIVRITYMPADGVFPDFSATPTSGASPLAVQFTDASVSIPNAITSWEWDFENDGTVDSTTQNPAFTYNGQCSSFDVSLKITDSTGRTSTIVKTAFIETDLVSADFTASQATGCAPLTVNFTDASSGAVSWAWDFENDGTVDSVVQNPSHTYTVNNQSYDVSLTVTNVCGRTDTIVKPGFARTVGALTTLFGANNGGSVGGTVYFDVTVTNAIDISGFETNYDVGVGSTVGLLVATVPGTYVGNETNAGAWTQVGIGTGVSAGLDAPSDIQLAAAFTLDPGTYGMALTSVGDGHRYTNGNGTNQSVSDANLQIDLGAASNVPFTGTPFSPRVWNGSILYCLGCPAGRVSSNGAGCADAGGSTFEIAYNGCAILNTTFGLDLNSPTASPTAVGIFVMGVFNTQWLGIPLPLDLTPFGAAGCSVYNSHDVIITAGAFVGGTVGFSATVPNDPALTISPSFWQGYQIDPAIGGALPLATTNGLTVLIQP